ncbi:MAG TPA: DNA repair protein RecO [Firmicutes bacterium]|jgi:DNA repair protein RecO (recombination protein O)|nr:DNA repair protein RecO [Bacillota bacterium]HOQ25045.1 DNA repair protein RecO [Bacillota bacterium]HPT68349.1 DNA repair protein RecO [Bacillota bacterium]
MALFRTEGLVLRVRAFGEADKIITLLTPERGKIEAVAKGARRPRNRFLGSTQLFSHLNMMLFGGKGLAQMNQAEIIHSFHLLRDDLLKMAYASYWCELSDGLLPEAEPEPEVFALLLQAFSLLETVDKPDLLSRGVELKLLAELGYLPVLGHCVGCEAIAAAPLHFSAVAGGVVGTCCRQRFPDALPVTGAAIKAMAVMLGTDLAGYGAFSASPELRQEICGILRRFIEVRMEKPLRSLAFLQGIEDL